MRHRTWKGVARTALLASCAFLGGAVTTGLAAATGEASSPYAFVKQLSRVLVIVENEYVEPVERARLLEGSIKGMVAELDPHSSYLTPSDYAMFRADTTGEFGGVGVEVDFRNDAVTIIAPIEGSPAHRAGVRPGDRIVAIDRESITGKSSAELVRRMRGKPGTSVIIAVRRAGQEALLDFTLVREVIEVASVASAALEGNIAYLRLKAFQRGTHTELLKELGAVRRAHSGRLDGVILDLRNNPGGLVNEAVAVANEFLEGGIIYTTRHRGATVDSVEAGHSGALRTAPTVVLVNEYSASAAELLAGALQDHKRATLVGMQTFGKGSVQSVIELPGSSGLRLTTMRYYTPNGRAIQAQGVLPDVMVEAAYEADKTFGVLRESDLENHLPAEGPSVEQKTDGAVHKASKKETEQTGISPTHMGVARKVPRDPTGGPDFALSIGYQIVRDVLKK